jgi:hypothetical protein
MSQQFLHMPLSLLIAIMPLIFRVGPKQRHRGLMNLPEICYQIIVLDDPNIRLIELWILAAGWNFGVIHSGYLEY